MPITRIILSLGILLFASAPSFGAKRSVDRRSARSKKVDAAAIFRWQQAGLSNAEILARIQRTESRLTRETLRRLEKLRVRKSLVQQLRELQRKKPSEKVVTEKPAARKAEPPKPEPELEDSRWTDPIALRDTLFLSAAAHHARADPGPAEEKKNSKQ